MRFLATWSGGNGRPQDTKVSAYADGDLRFSVVNSGEWIACEAQEFLLGAMYAMDHKISRHKPMVKWRDAAEGDLPDNARIGIKSSANETTHHVIIGFNNGCITLEQMTVDIKTVCMATAKVMKPLAMHTTLIDALKNVWWD